MIRAILANDIQTVYNFLTTVALTWVIVLGGIVLDLFYGVKKAKQLNEARTSEGYRRTTKKVSYYYSTMLFAFMLDCLLGVFSWYDMPYGSCLAAAFLVFCEYKSVREKADAKQRRRVDTSAKEVLQALKESPDAAQVLTKLFTTNGEKSGTDTGSEEQ